MFVFFHTGRDILILLSITLESVLFSHGQVHIASEPIFIIIGCGKDPRSLCSGQQVQVCFRTIELMSDWAADLNELLCSQSNANIDAVIDGMSRWHKRGGERRGRRRRRRRKRRWCVGEKQCYWIIGHIFCVHVCNDLASACRKGLLHALVCYICYCLLVLCRVVGNKNSYSAHIFHGYLLGELYVLITDMFASLKLLHKKFLQLKP